MNISVLLTCHNRQAKTETCLHSLKEALEAYNNETEEKIYIEIFLTDDGCADDTAEAASAIFPDERVLHILRGDGNLYWAGGMRYCWQEAMKRRAEWDYYLLLNDDVELMLNLFDELFYAEKYAKENYAKEGVVSGITCSKKESRTMTYGGDIITNRFLFKMHRLEPNGKPQMCDLTNANILLVAKTVVDQIGIFHEHYRHGQADYDYSVMARNAGFPVVLTANFCGYCEKDHLDEKDRAERVMAMSLKERKKYFSNPIHSNRDYLHFIRRTSPIRFPFVWIGRTLNLYCPKFYYRISGIRKGGKL